MVIVMTALETEDGKPPDVAAAPGSELFKVPTISTSELYAAAADSAAQTPTLICSKIV